MFSLNLEGNVIEEKNLVTIEEFINELQQEFEYHLNGGTPYRQETARLSVLVAKQAGVVAPFLERKNTASLVREILIGGNLERQTDVSEMLYHIARDLYRKKNIPKETLLKIEEERKRILKNKLSLLQKGK